MDLPPPPRGPGRPKSTGETLTVERPYKFSPSMYERMSDAAREAEISVAEFVRRAVRDKLEPQPISLEQALAGTDQFRARLLAHVPAGPWEAALEEAGHFVVSKDVADELEARDGDVFVRAEGQSMEDAGIPDGALVLVRPLDGRLPRSGESAVVEVTDENGDYWGTLKKWYNGSPPRLADGRDQPFGLPEATRRLRPVAVARGILTRLY